MLSNTRTNGHLYQINLCDLQIVLTKCCISPNWWFMMVGIGLYTDDMHDNNAALPLLPIIIFLWPSRVRAGPTYRGPDPGPT
ncbi:hypothetical protein TNCV_71041 [Trichonephila clavipes]|nr:hypothetical protein TNCV_71041 [Trichonephila clavipes]